jgi:hypothetical protein
MPAGSTYSTIATTTFGSNATEYTFSSIPTTYTDLILISNWKFTTSTPQYGIQVGNGSVDTGNNYSLTWLGNTSTATSSREANVSRISFYQFYGGSTNGQVAIAQFQNYSNTTTNKTILYRLSDIDEMGHGVGLWRGTSAINTIKVFSPNGTIAAGATFTLYGIAAA